MKVGLINIEPKIYNTAYMQIAYHHRGKGDTVRLVGVDKDLTQYDKLYCSSLFDFTDKSKVPERTVCGGTGFDLKTKLPFDCDLDYSIYPDCECTYLWFSRGCIRNCGFCVVREKEGKIRPVEPKNLNPKGKYIQVQDNNYFANPAWKRNKWKLWSFNQPVDFQGIDVRLLTREMCEFLRYTRLHGQLKIAWDRFADKHVVLDKIKMLLRYVSRSKIRCYVLVGYKSTERQDLQRLRTLHQIGIDPYVMCMDRKNSLYQRKIQKWNNGFAFRKVKWEDFEF
jgi:hypothetical protein